LLSKGTGIVIQISFSVYWVVHLANGSFAFSCRLMRWRCGSEPGQWLLAPFKIVLIEFIDILEESKDRPFHTQVKCKPNKTE